MFRYKIRSMNTILYLIAPFIEKVNILFNTLLLLHMGLKHASREKKLPMVNFLIFVHKNVYRIRFQKIKIGPLKGFEKKAFFSLLLMRKRLSGGQKWFLKPYFPLIRGMFVFRSGLRFSFRALEMEMPEPRVRKRPLSPTNKFGPFPQNPLMARF